MPKDAISGNICFVANFYKTEVFNVIARELAAKGIGVYWIVTKAEQYQQLKNEYSGDRVLYINRSFARKKSPTVGDFRLNELIYGDRVFKHDIKTGISFLENIQQPVFEFIRKNNLRFVIGEITWAHELLILRIVQKCFAGKCIYLDCGVVRIPNKRFAFFTDESQYSMLEFNRNIGAVKMIQVEKPFYLKVNDQIVKQSSSVKGRLHRIKRFISGENIEENDPNVITDVPKRFVESSREELNRITYRRVPTVSFEEIKDKNFVFIGFHKQPESSIDVMGRYYEDQALNTINLWRMLPRDWIIVLKEHTNAIGDRSFRFYKKLLSFPGIVMVNETTDSRVLIEKSRLVATVTGTIAYEAALLGKPAITFSKVFFNRLNFCRYVPLHALVNYENLGALADDIMRQPDNRLEFSEYLMNNSFEGYITDYISSPQVMDSENIKAVVNAFETLIREYR